MNETIIGWREWVGLPELGIERMKAKVDTGARTSALHAFDIDVYRKHGQEWVRFTVHPLQKNELDSRICTSRVQDTRVVTNSGGSREKRIVIETTLLLGERAWPIEITLTNRDQMGFRMLVGRTAIKHHYLVHPGKSFCLGK